MLKSIFKILLIISAICLFATLMRQAFGENTPVTIRGIIDKVNQFNFSYDSVIDSMRDLGESLSAVVQKLKSVDLIGAVLSLWQSIFNGFKILYSFLWSSTVNGYEMIRVVFWLFTATTLPPLPFV